MTERASHSQCALVTAASAGIGQELARVLAANRFNLVLLARSRDKLQDLACELKANHDINVTIIAADLAEPREVARQVPDDLRMVITREARLRHPGRTISVPSGGFSLESRTSLRLPSA